MIERGVREEVVNWKVLFKIGENWRNGVSPLDFTRQRTDSFCQADAHFRRLIPVPARVRSQLNNLRTLRVCHCGPNPLLSR